ncbi:YraN family protein [Bacteroidetes/Chlorobi group bacterium Naka2016]|jgi:putative endonuclease|nr:MAG: YraN family protein [Bacteroidetes/Chlorobi group bacterium Naka2016]
MQEKQKIKVEKPTDTGKRGEEIACDYLLNKGYKILKRNFHFGKLGELDIVAEKDDCLVFVEVKLQTTDNFGDSRFWITPAKQKKLKKTAEGYIYTKKIQNKSCRFDAIFIDLRYNPPLINHIENAF